jgi:cold shock CspA family protein
MLHQGKLKEWDSAQGTGFLQQDKAGPDIRISSSGFRKKPDQLNNGDLIFFQIEVDAEGKAQAVSAYKAGQRFAPAPAVKKPTLSSLPFQQLLSVVVTVTILAWLGYQSVYLFSAHAAPALPVITEPAPSDELVSPARQTRYEQHFQCEGKQHCSEMLSCDEAKFYLKNCPDVMIDGDNDGIPCERQHCGHRRF